MMKIALLSVLLSFHALCADLSSSTAATVIERLTVTLNISNEEIKKAALHVRSLELRFAEAQKSLRVARADLNARPDTTLLAYRQLQAQAVRDAADLVTRTQELDAFDLRIAAHLATIAAGDATIAERDATIADNARTILELRAQIAADALTIADKDAKIAADALTILELQAQIVALNARAGLVPGLQQQIAVLQDPAFSAQLLIKLGYSVIKRK